MDRKRDPDDVRMAVAAAIGRFLLGAGAGVVVWWFAMDIAHFNLPKWAFTAWCILPIVLTCGLVALLLPRFASRAWPALCHAIREWWIWGD